MYSRVNYFGEYIKRKILFDYQFEWIVLAIKWCCVSLPRNINLWNTPISVFLSTPDWHVCIITYTDWYTIFIYKYPFPLHISITMLPYIFYFLSFLQSPWTFVVWRVTIFVFLLAKTSIVCYNWQINYCKGSSYIAVFVRCRFTSNKCLCKHIFNSHSCVSISQMWRNKFNSVAAS